MLSITPAIFNNDVVCYVITFWVLCQAKRQIFSKQLDTAIVAADELIAQPARGLLPIAKASQQRILAILGLDIQQRLLPIPIPQLVHWVGRKKVLLRIAKPH